MIGTNRYIQKWEFTTEFETQKLISFGFGYRLIYRRRCHHQDTICGKLILHEFCAQ